MKIAVDIETSSEVIDFYTKHEAQGRLLIIDKSAEGRLYLGFRYLTIIEKFLRFFGLGSSIFQNVIQFALDNELLPHLSEDVRNKFITKIRAYQAKSGQLSTHCDLLTTAEKEERISAQALRLTQTHDHDIISQIDKLVTSRPVPQVRLEIEPKLPIQLVKATLLKLARKKSIRLQDEPYLAHRIVRANNRPCGG